MSVGAMRMVVLLRDGGCVAPKLDPGSGPCHDRWGQEGPVPIGSLEADYVRLGAKGDRHRRSVDHVALCPGHHRGAGPNAGYVWATANRALLREYLDSLDHMGDADGAHG